MQTRYDTAPIKTLTTDAQTGFLYVKDVPIARAGVFPYRRADGSTTMEAKLPQEILTVDTVDSANGKPVTNDHPRELVTKSNVSEYMKGFTASNAHVDGDYLRVDMAITDPDLIKAINGGKRELSIGFQTDVDPSKGTYKGVAYDSVQRNIQINHVAVVQRGRAGHTVRIMGDSAEMIEDDSHFEPEKGKSMKFKKVMLDGREITVAEDDADAVTNANSNSNDKDKKIAQLEATIKDLQAQLEKKKGDDKDNADKSQAKADALDKELQETKAELEATKKKYEGDALDKLVDERLAVVNAVKPYLADDYDFAGKPVRKLKEDALLAVDKSFDPTGKSDTYVDTYFDFYRNNHKSGVVGYNGAPQQKTEVDGVDETLQLRDSAYNLYNQGGNK